MVAFSFLQAQGEHPDGGGAYIAGLIDGLRALGHDVDTTPSAGRTLVIDGLALATVPDAVLDGAIGLIHHTTPLVADADKPAARSIERERIGRLRHVVATDAAAASRLADQGLAADRISMLPPGVPELPRSTGSGTGCAILAVGALVPRKGHATLLRALARLFDLDWRLTIAGRDDRDPAHAAALREQAQSAGIAARVHFAGALAADALEAAWREADLFALASEWEGYATAAAIALRRGLPVAVTAGGAAAEGISPQLGVVAPPGDSEQLSKAMRRLIFDAGLRADMAEAAWQAGQALPRWEEQAALFVRATT